MTMDEKYNPTFNEWLAEYYDSGYGALGRWFMGSRCEPPRKYQTCTCDCCSSLREEYNQFINGEKNTTAANSNNVEAME